VKKLYKIIPLLLFTLSGLIIYPQEICDNAIDDDNDGFIDLNDDECICDELIPINNLIESYIPNPSFEDYTCLPNNLSQLDCAVDWIQASDGSTDYYHNISFPSMSISLPNYLPLPEPPPNSPADGDAFVGFIVNYNGNSASNEYLGTCLNTPFVSNESYTISLELGFGNDQISNYTQTQ